MENQILDDGLFDKPVKLDDETIEKINITKNVLNDNIQNVIHARYALIFVVILNFIGMVLGMKNIDFDSFSIEIIIESFILIMVFITCVIGIFYNPRASLIIALIFYFLHWGIHFMLAPDTVFKGIVLKIIVINFIARGIASAFKLENGLKELIRLGIPKEEILQAKKLKRLPRTFTISSS